MEIGLWRAALPYLFRVLQVAFGCAAAALLWKAVHGFAAGPARPELPPLEEPAVLVGGSAPGDYEVIGRRNLFRALESEAKKPVEAPVAPSRLQATLLGTVLAEPAALSMGVVRDPSTNRIVLVRIGDAIAAGQAKVVKIEHRRIVVEHGGRLEAIEFEQPPEVPRPSRRANPLRPVAQDRVRQLAARQALRKSGRPGFDLGTPRIAEGLDLPGQPGGEPHSSAPSADFDPDRVPTP